MVGRGSETLMARIQVSKDVRGVTGGIISSLSEDERRRYDKLVRSGMLPDRAAQQIFREIDDEMSTQSRDASREKRSAVVRFAPAPGFSEIDPERFSYRRAIGDFVADGSAEGPVWESNDQEYFVFGSSWTDNGAERFARLRDRQIVERRVSNEFVLRLRRASDQSAGSTTSLY